MKNCFVCCTPVQIMRAVYMRYAMKEFDQESDLYINPTFYNAHKIAENLEKTGLFAHVYLFDISTMHRAVSLRLIYGNNRWAKIIRNNSYDKLIAFNLEGEIITALYHRNRQNRDFEYHCAEDAPGLYPMYAPAVYERTNLNRILGVEQPFYGVHTWWFSQPDFMEIPDLDNPHKQILPPVNVNDRGYIELVNRVFEYQRNFQLEKADILIMEESFYTDNRMIDNFDFKLYQNIQNEFKDKNILVKLHPRTKENRFKDGFEIMENTWVPWEMHLLNSANNNNSFPIQLGIICSTLVSDKFMFDLENQKVILAPLFYDYIKCRSDGNPIIEPLLIHKYETLKSTYKDPEKIVIIYDKLKLLENVRSLLSYSKRAM